MKKQNKLLPLIYMWSILLLLLVIVNYKDFFDYINILASNTNYLLFNLIIIIIILLLLINARLKVNRAEQKASDKYTESLIDKMTKVYNKTGLYELGNDKWDIALREGWSFAAVFIDIDKFKTFNDTYGHMVGDLLITKVAEVLKKSVRLETDIVARYGGDEFVILLSNIDKNTLHILAKRIQRIIKELKIKEINEPLTLSIGINYMKKINENNNLDEIIHLSDEALYISKSKGGNQYQFNK